MKTSHGFSSSKRSNKFRIPLLLSLLVFLVLSPLSSGYPAKPGSSDIYSGNEKAYIEVDARATMGVTISLIETYLQQALTSLRLIAASPATRSGIWPEIKPGLETLRNAEQANQALLQVAAGAYESLISTEEDIEDLKEYLGKHAGTDCSRWQRSHIQNLARTWIREVYRERIYPRVAQQVDETPEVEIKALVRELVKDPFVGVQLLTMGDKLHADR